MDLAVRRPDSERLGRRHRDSGASRMVPSIVEPTCEKPTGTIYLVWQGGETSDFMLKFESKGTGNVNGGVQFRSYMTADNNVATEVSGPRRRRQSCANAGRGPGGPGRGGAPERGGAAEVAAARSARIPALRRAPPSAPSGTWPARSSISTPTTRYAGQYYEQSVEPRYRCPLREPLSWPNPGSGGFSTPSPIKPHWIRGSRKTITTSF